MIKFVFLDLDDTILDFHKAEYDAISDTLRTVGIEPTCDTVRLYSKINRAHWERLERGELTREQVLFGRFATLFSKLGAEGSPEKTQEIYEELLSANHPFMTDGRWLLDTLYGKYRLFVASNGTAKVQDRRISESNIGGYFEDIFISQRIGYDKPRPEFFEACFQKIEGFSRDEAIIVGDSMTSDIIGGIRAGIKTCHFNHRGQENTLGYYPDFEIKTLRELPDLLEKL